MANNPTYNIEKFHLGALGGDVSLLQTTDGVKMIDLWLQVIAPGLAAYNSLENLLANFMGFKSDIRMEQVVQTVGSSWQKNTEVTKGVSTVDMRRSWIRTATSEYKHYLGYTKKFITENSADHLVQMFDAGLKALTNQKYQEIITAFFYMGGRPVVDLKTHESLVLPGFVDGTGDWPIPPNGTNTFATSHNHFMAVDSTSSNWTNTTNRQAQLRSLIRLITEHGYRRNILLMFNASNSDDVIACPGFRQLVALSPMAVASPDAALRGLDTQVTIKDFQAFAGLFRAIGTVENATCLECDFLPVGYYATFSYEGDNNPDNPVQWYETPVTSFSDNPYPYYETMLETEFGASIRKRLNGALMQVGSGVSSYANPAFATAGAVVHDWDGQ